MGDGQAVWSSVCGNGAVSDFVMKIELNNMAKLSIYWAVYVPTLTDGHELSLAIQAAKMKFFLRMADRSLRDKVRSSDFQMELRVKSLLLRIKRNQSK